MSPDQSRSRRQPKDNWSQPAGTARRSISGDTRVMAMMPSAMDAVERMQNWKTSVTTTLNMPPLTT